MPILFVKFAPELVQKLKHVKKLKSSFLVYCHLSSYADWDTGRVTIKLAKIAKELELSRMCVSRHICNLRQHKYISTRQAKNGLVIDILHYPLRKKK